MKPAKKLLNGKVPTNKQYRNWKAPVTTMYTKYASINLSLVDVRLAYSSTNRDKTENTETAMIFASKPPFNTNFR